MTPADPRAAAMEQINRALEEVSEIARDPRRRFRMSIPARPDYDSDILITQALVEARALLALPVAETQRTDLDRALQAEASARYQEERAIKAENELARLNALPVAETGWHEEKAKLLDDLSVELWRLRGNSAFQSCAGVFIALDRWVRLKSVPAPPEPPEGEKRDA